jgi:hypothetical protein
MSRLIEHVKSSGDRYVIRLNQIEPGQIIDTYYKAKDGGNKRYMMVVIDPDYNGLLHAIKLNDVPKSQFIKIVEKFGITYDKLKRPIVNVAEVDLADVKKQFYDVTRGLSRTRDAYRTFIPKGLNRTYVVDYFFGKLSKVTLRPSDDD